jgi:hypothetical protein
MPTATPLTTAKFFADTQLTETTLPGTSGILVHTYNFEVDHDFRRWLTGIGKFTYGTLDYQGDNRTDKIYTLSGDLIYKLTRSLVSAAVDTLPGGLPVGLCIARAAGRHRHGDRGARSARHALGPGLGRAGSAGSSVGPEQPRHPRHAQGARPAPTAAGKP